MFREPVKRAPVIYEFGTVTNVTFVDLLGVAEMRGVAL